MRELRIFGMSGAREREREQERERLFFRREDEFFERCMVFSQQLVCISDKQQSVVVAATVRCDGCIEAEMV